jgi:hypothetical protein
MTESRLEPVNELGGEGMRMAIVKQAGDGLDAEVTMQL